MQTFLLWHLLCLCGMRLLQRPRACCARCCAAGRRAAARRPPSGFLWCRQVGGWEVGCMGVGGKGQAGVLRASGWFV